MKLKGKRFLAILLMLAMMLGILPAMNFSTAVYAEEPAGITEGSQDETDEPAEMDAAALSPADKTDEEKKDADPENPAEPSENAGDPEQDEAEPVDKKESENETPAAAVLEGNGESKQDDADPDNTVTEEPQDPAETPQSEEETADTSHVMFGAPALKENGTDGETVADSNDAHTHTDASGNVITFEPWNDSSSLPTASGNYYLTQDVTMSSGWSVPNGTFNLCLNGKTIRADAAAGVILMRGSGKTVNLFDEPENAGKIINTQTDHRKTGGGVHILQGELNMYGGTITGCIGYDGGGVYVEDGVFRMYGGEISNNSSGHAGGVFLQNSTFSMFGGRITNNTGTDAGGVYSSRNPITVSGSPIVTGNQANGIANNISLYDSSKILIAGPLSQDASMGITMSTTTGTFTKGSGDIKPKDYIVNFSSDNADYAVMTIGSDLRIAKKKQNAPMEEGVPAGVIANNRLYDGTEKPLVTVDGEADGGTMFYALGTDAETAPDTGWDAEIPTASEEGTYYVWYIVGGDECHEDSAPAGVTVTISRNVYTASADHSADHPEWQKGSSGSLTITFKGTLDDEKTYSKWDHKVVIDGSEVPASAYSHKSGSLVIDLKPSYLETLSVGTHTMNVSFIDGSASAQFSIKEGVSSGGGSSTPEKNDTVVTCQMAGYPAGYAWNESAKACQPGYVDAGGAFHPNRSAIPNTYDTGLAGFVRMNLISLVIALLCMITLRSTR